MLVVLGSSVAVGGGVCQVLDGLRGQAVNGNRYVEKMFRFMEGTTSTTENAEDGIAFLKELGNLMKEGGAGGRAKLPGAKGRGPRVRRTRKFTISCMPCS